jgi:hypothetical protein
MLLVTLPSDVRELGATGDGRTLDTAALQRAIDLKGAVCLRDGTFLSGTLRLKSNTSLIIEPSATLLGSARAEDYPELRPPLTNGQLSNCRRALLYAEGTTQVTITGGGRILGPGAAFEHAARREPERPMTIFAAAGSHLLVSDLELRDAAMWTLVAMELTQVTLRSLRVRTHGITRDGLVLVDCHQALITDCDLDTGDDAVCLKSHSIFGLREIEVRHCRLRTHTNALKVGTPTYGPIKQVHCHDLTIDGARLAGIAVECIDGSAQKNLRFERITMRNVGAPFFVLLGDRGLTPPGLPHKQGSIEGLAFVDITATQPSAAWGCLVTGSMVNGQRWALQGVRFERVALECGQLPGPPPQAPPEYVGHYPDCDMWGAMPASGYFIRHAGAVSLHDCSTTGRDARPWLALHDVTENPVTTIRVRRDVGFGAHVTLRGEGPALSWARGASTRWAPGNVWVWESSAVPSGVPFAFKSLRNDLDWEAGDDRLAVGGQTTECSAR